MNKNERKLIRLYHYIKYFSFVSIFTIIGLFVQTIEVESTSYFYYQTNLAITLIPFIIFAILVSIIFFFGRIRLSELYYQESIFLKGLVHLPASHRRLLLKTSNGGLFSDRPQICYLEEIGSKLKINYKWKGELFVSYVKWKNVAAFGLPNVKQKEAFQKVLNEERIDSDYKFDN